MGHPLQRRWAGLSPAHAAGIAFAAGMAFVGAAYAAGGDTYVSYTGTADAPRTDAFLYGENHVVRYRDGKIAERVVLYTCRDGVPFARKTVSYVDALTPDFLLEDASNGMREGVRGDRDSREVFFRPDGSDAEKSRALPRVPQLVADSGFDEFVRMNWQPLMGGQTLSMPFLIPSRLEEMKFRVEHVGSDRVDGTPAEVFRLKLSGVLGWAVPGIDVYYGAHDHVLLRYVGLSDLRNGSRDNFQAEIAFRPGDRKPADAQRIASARDAPLRACK